MKQQIIATIILWFLAPIHVKCFCLVFLVSYLLKMSCLVRMRWMRMRTGCKMCFHFSFVRLECSCWCSTTLMPVSVSCQSCLHKNAFHFFSFLNHRKSCYMTHKCSILFHFNHHFWFGKFFNALLHMFRALIQSFHTERKKTHFWT